MSSIMDNKALWDKINIAYKADKVNHPSWPDHVCGQAAMVGAASGNLLYLSTLKKYKLTKIEPDKLTILLETEAINTIVQAVRFLENLK